MYGVVKVETVGMDGNARWLVDDKDTAIAAVISNDRYRGVDDQRLMSMRAMRVNDIVLFKKIIDRDDALVHGNPALGQHIGLDVERVNNIVSMPMSGQLIQNPKQMTIQSSIQMFYTGIQSREHLQWSGRTSDPWPP